MSDQLLKEAQALCAKLNRAGCQRAAVYARIPYSVARLEEDRYLAKVERANAEQHSFLEAA